MKNFLRSLRYSWAYRYRLALSVTCALAAAALWSLNFMAIYPVLKILTSEMTLHQWVEHRIDETQKQVKVFGDELAARRAFAERIEGLPPGPQKDKAEHKSTSDITKLENKLGAAQTSLWRYQQLKFYFIRFLPEDGFLTLVSLLGMVIVGVALKGVFEYGQETLVGSVMNRTLFDLRNRFYRNVLDLDVNQFGPDGSQELSARFTNDMTLLGNGINTVYGKVVAEPLRAIGCIIFACFISWQLTLMFLVLVPASLAILTKVGRMMKRASRRLLERMTSIYKILQDTFQGIRLVKAYTRESSERRKFRVATEDYYQKAMQVIHIDAAAGPIVELLGVAAVAIALLAGAYLVLQHKTHLFGLRMTDSPMEAETLLQLYALLAAIADPVRKLSSVYTKIQSGSAAADRIFGYMDRQAEVTANAQGPHLPRLRHQIEFRDVCFSYVPGGKPALSHIDLVVRAGETIALVGTNGCGKSTLIGLLTRFYDPDHGSVLFDGIDIRHANLRSLRRQVGLVTQDPFLFADTLAANIGYGLRRATQAQIEAAARQAFAHEIIERLPNGYETRLGECGRKLSGGESQRVALARAILRDPAVLILDEFTSQVDAESEAKIHQALRSFVRGRTTFIITHRLHTLEIADRIVVMDNGRIEAIGTHEELLRSCLTYQRLHEAHFQRKVA